MTPTARLLHLAICFAIVPAGLTHAETIAATNFDGRTLPSSNIASGLNWTLNGVDDPGDMAALNAGGAAQALFDANATVQNIFAPGINVGNGNTFWTTEVALTVAEGASITLSDVTFNSVSINGGQNQNVNRRNDYTVSLFSPSDAITPITEVTVGDTLAGTGAGQPLVTFDLVDTALTEPGTYTLRIQGGDFVGPDETGNHTAIDNLSINGTNGVDGAAPTPDPMTFAIAPIATGPTSITMTADTASDDSGVEYQFTNTTLATDSPWQDGTEWTDTGLTAGSEYFYTVTARDKSPDQNTTAPSTPVAATTDGIDVTAPSPDPMTFAVAPAAAGQFAITMTAETASDGGGVEYLFTNTTLASDSGWQGSAEWTDTGLAAGTEYIYTVTARDQSPAQNATAPSAPLAATTDATDVNPPSPDPMSFAVLPARVDNTSVSMTATTATDDSGVEYLFENLTLGTDSGWQSSPSWTDTGLAPDMTYEYTVTARDTSPSQSETSPSASASVSLVRVIAATSFDGQTIGGNTASDLNWVLDGVEDPGSMSATVEDSATTQNLFNSEAFNQNQFAPQINVGNGNTWWRTSVDLTVLAGSAVTVTEVNFDYWAINGGGAQNIGRRSDFTVTLYDPSEAVVGTASILDVSNGTVAGSPTAVSLPFPAPIPLSEPGTYRLDIDGGELGGADETGNHAGIDNLAIIGTTGSSASFAITEIEYNPNGDPNPTVTLTWRQTGAASYIAYLSSDLGNWDEDLDDSITAEDDERPEDADHFTMTFPLEGGRGDASELFFRIVGG